MIAVLHEVIKIKSNCSLMMLQTINCITRIISATLVLIYRRVYYGTRSDSNP